MPRRRRYEPLSIFPKRRSEELFFSEKNYSAVRHGELNSSWKWRVVVTGLGIRDRHDISYGHPSGF